MIEINERNFEDFLKEDGIMVIDFWASWCMPCLALKPVIEEIEKEMGEIKFGSVNVDENIELARRFGVISIPTLIILINGKEEDRMVGYLPKEEIKERLEYYKGIFSP
ncbi:MAG TPA: thioredoxin [Thermoplasmatales archaeon]|nr:thioredoxin [Thermoplasmatales archaeon]